MLKDRFRGAVVGTAVGDALGAPFEGRPRVDPAAFADWQRSDTPMRWTDDTHMTIGVAESLIAVGGFDGGHMAGRFVAHHDAEPWRGYGAGPPIVFAALREGTDWWEPATRLFSGAGSFGNGAAMRSAPIGLFFCHDLPLAATAAWDAAGITHAHELGRQGAAMQAYSSGWLATMDEDLDRSGAEALIGSLRRRVATDAAFASRFDAVNELPGDTPAPEVVDALGHGIEAVEAVPAALHATLAHPRSFPDAVGHAVALGGDTDTIAAMAGALSGAHLGGSAIPDEWLRRLEAADRLVALADELWAASPATGANQPSGDR